MTDPRTTPHDDEPREHRGIGQRIMDAVLGDPADQRHDDPAGTRRDDPADTRQVDADRPGGGVGGGDQPRGEYASYEQAMRDHSSGGATLEDRGSVQDVDTRRDTAGYGYADDTRRDSGQAGLGDDARRDAGQAGYADDARRDAGQAGYVDRGEAARDAGYDARDTRTTGTTTGADRDFVTPSYDPDRDRGYDPQAAGTAVDDRAAAGTRADADRDFGAGRGDQDREYDPQASGAVTDPAAGPVARNTPGPTHGDADYDTARDTGYVDDQRGGASRDYDPAQDTGYVDASRAEADRTTGRRDDDYDTGRVDTAGRTPPVASAPSGSTRTARTRTVEPEWPREPPEPSRRRGGVRGRPWRQRPRHRPRHRPRPTATPRSFSDVGRHRDRRRHRHRPEHTGHR